MVVREKRIQVKLQLKSGNETIPEPLFFSSTSSQGETFSSTKIKCEPLLHIYIDKYEHPLFAFHGYINIQ